MVLCTIFKGSQTVQKLLSTRFTTLNFSEELPEPVTSKPISLASWRRMKFCITVCCTAFLGKLCYPPVPVNMFFIFFSGVLPVPVSRKDSIHPSQELEGRNFVLWYFVPCFGPYAFPCFLSTKFSNFLSPDGARPATVSPSHWHTPDKSPVHRHDATCRPASLSGPPQRLASAHGSGGAWQASAVSCNRSDGPTLGILLQRFSRSAAPVADNGAVPASSAHCR